MTQYQFEMPYIKGHYPYGNPVRTEITGGRLKKIKTGRGEAYVPIRIKTGIPTNSNDDKYLEQVQHDQGRQAAVQAAALLANPMIGPGMRRTDWVHKDYHSTNSAQAGFDKFAHGLASVFTPSRTAAALGAVGSAFGIPGASTAGTIASTALEKAGMGKRKWKKRRYRRR